MGDLYEDTVTKIEYLKKCGFEVEQLWECELREKMEKDEEMKQHVEEHEEPMPQSYSTNVRAIRKSSKLH